MTMTVVYADALMDKRYDRLSFWRIFKNVRNFTQFSLGASIFRDCLMWSQNRRILPALYADRPLLPF